MKAKLTALRNPMPLLRAVDAGETVVLTKHGKPRYELRKAAGRVNWDAVEADRETWLTEADAKELEAAIAASGRVLTGEMVP